MSVTFYFILYSRKQFPQYGKGKKSPKQKYFVPKNTCTINVCVLANKGTVFTPSSQEITNLSLSGLGKKRIVFPDKNGDHYFFQATLEDHFPKLEKLEGAFSLYRAASGGSGCRKLIKIPMGAGGYSLPWLRINCSVGSSSTIYIVPLQQDLDVKSSTPNTQVSKIKDIYFIN